MSAYLVAESAFIRSLANRFLLLTFIAGLTRMGGGDIVKGNAAIMGVNLQISQGWLITAGPVLCILFALLMASEAECLTASRFVILAEFSKGFAFRRSKLPFALFFAPALISLFFTVQFVINLIPADMQCETFPRTKMLTDFSLIGGSASIFCIGDVTTNMPWIYPPIQTYAYLALSLWCLQIAIRTSKTWVKFRGQALVTTSSSPD